MSPTKEERRQALNAYQREYAANHREYFREAARKWYARARLKDERRYTEYKSAARRHRRVFELTLEDFKRLRALECLYCGLHTDSMGIDRINSAIGYTLPNAVPCCAECNYMKSDTEAAVFLDKCRLIVERIEIIKQSTCAA